MASGVLNLGRPGGVGVRSGGSYCGVLGMGWTVSPCTDRDDLDEEGRERGGEGRSAREKDSLRRAEVRARRVEIDGESRRRLRIDGW